MEAELKAKYFKDTINSIQAIVNECRLHFDPMGLHVIAVDTANVSEIELKLPKECFERFPAESHTYCVDAEKIQKILSLVDDKENIILKISEDSKKLKIKFANYEYEMIVIDDRCIRSDPQVPNFTFSAELQVPAADFCDSVRAAAIVNDKVYMIAEAATKTLKVHGASDTRCITREFTDIEFTKLGDARSLFSLDYIARMCKNMHNCNKITVNIGNDIPILFTFAYADGKGEIKYICAPRIEET